MDDGQLLRIACETSDLATVARLADPGRPALDLDLLCQELINAVIKDQRPVFDLLVPMLIDPNNLVDYSNEHRKDMWYLKVAKAALASEEIHYWKQLAKYLIHDIPICPADAPDCSITVLQYLHARDQLTEAWWCGILINASNYVDVGARIQKLWQIRVSPSGICTDDDRQLVGDTLIALVEMCRRMPDNWSNPAYRPLFEDLCERAAKACLVAQALLDIYPEVIADHGERLMRTILTTYTTEHARSKLPDCYAKWLTQLPNLDWSCAPIILTNLVTDLPNGAIVAIMEHTRDAEIQYLYDDERDYSILISWSPLSKRLVGGWTSFKYCGRYFYSRGWYLDLDNHELVYGVTGLLVGPDLNCEMEMPDPEQEIEIAYGRDYQNTMAISAPQILITWYESRSRAKSARSLGSA